jgi:hypothetical protein
MKTAILLLVFNRVESTRTVFESIRQAKPARLYVAADGPHLDQPGEYELCEEARKVATEVDWPCEVRTLLRKENLGCGKAVAEGITWFFKQEAEGIILEDDCLPHPTFFRFCDELLEHYRDDKRIVAISGDNFQKQNGSNKQSYYFSIYYHSWGWATWRRAWQYYDGELSQWPSLRATSWLGDLLTDSATARYWHNIFDMVQAGKIDTWDYQWTYSCWSQSGLSILPSVNLVTNIGFDDRAAHTKDPKHALANLPSLPMEFPLRHPLYMIRDFTADRHDTRHVFGVQTGQTLKWLAQARNPLSARYRRLLGYIRRVIARM